MRRSATVHILANTDAVVPRHFPVEHLYGLTWNPDRLADELDAIDGVREAKRAGVDGMSPTASALLARVAPRAEIVDAGRIFTELWGIPDRDKVAGVERAAIVTRDGLGAMTAALVPGVTPRELRGVCGAQFAFHGTTTPAFEAVAAPLAEGSSSWLPPARALDEGERVVLRAGALRDGWEASVARTFVVGTPSVEQPVPAGWDHLVAMCVSGTTAGALRATGAVVNGVGRGVEPWPDDLVLAPGLLVAIELRDDASLRQDVYRVTSHTPAPVTA